MPAALPMALRARFQDYITEGLSGRAAASRLKVSAATGFAGFERFASEGKSRLKRKDVPKGMVSSHPIAHFWKSWLRRMVILRCQNWPEPWRLQQVLLRIRHPSAGF